MKNRFNFKSIFIAIILIGFTTTVGIAAIWTGLNLLNWDLTTQEQLEFDNENLSLNEYIYIYSGETKLISFPRKVETIEFSKDSGFSIRTLVGGLWKDMSNNPDDYEVMQWYIVRNFWEERVNIHVTYSPITSADQTLYQKELKAGWNLYAPAVKNDYCTAVKTSDALIGSNYSQIIDFSTMWFKKYFSNEVSIDHIYSGETLFFNKYNGNPQDFREDGNYSIKNSWDAGEDFIYEWSAYWVFVNNDTLVSWNQNITDGSGNELIRYNSHPLVVFKDNSSKELDIIDNNKVELLNFDLTSKYAGEDEKGTSSILASLSISAFDWKWSKLTDVFDNITLKVDWLDSPFTTTQCRIDDKIEKCNNGNIYLHLIEPKLLTRGLVTNFVLEANTKNNIKTNYDLRLDLSNTLILDDQNLLPYCKYEGYILGDKNYSGRDINIDTTEEEDILGALSCASEQIFIDNACSICSTVNKMSQWDTFGFISDDWVNDSTSDMILYKEIQEEPIMINLNPDTIQWNHIPSSVGFWQNTPEFDNLYSEAEDGYILEAGNEVIWIKSKLGYGYQLTKNSEQVNTNIGLLKFNIKSHAIDSFWNINQEQKDENHCMLIKSEWSIDTPTLLSAPENIQLLDSSTWSLTIYWDSVIDAASYNTYIYKKTWDDILSHLELLTSTGTITNNNTFTFENLENGTTYLIMVNANDWDWENWENSNIVEFSTVLSDDILSELDCLLSGNCDNWTGSTNTGSTLWLVGEIRLLNSSTWSLSVEWDEVENASSYSIKHWLSSLVDISQTWLSDLMMSPWLLTTETAMFLDGLEVWTEYSILIVAYSWNKEVMSEEFRFTTESEIIATTLIPTVSKQLSIGSAELKIFVDPWTNNWALIELTSLNFTTPGATEWKKYRIENIDWSASWSTASVTNWNINFNVSGDSDFNLTVDWSYSITPENMDPDETTSLELQSIDYTIWTDNFTKILENPLDFGTFTY
jgi:hypothetical protein